MKLNKNDYIFLALSVLLIVLTIRVLNQSDSYDCNKCQIYFKSKPFMSEVSINLNVSIKEITRDLNNGECTFVWDKIQGWR